MAGDWIKMRSGLRRDPKVIAIARRLSSNRDFMNWWSVPGGERCHERVTEIVTFANVTRVTVCALLDVWAALNNAINADGKAPWMCLQDIDDIAEIPGFGDAMKTVGWVIEKEDKSLLFPNFFENNTPTKERNKGTKTDAERAKEYRERKKAKQQELHTVTPSRHVTGDKRREEKNIVIPQTRAHEVPKLADVQHYARNAPVPISGECAQAFFDTQEAAGWVTKHGLSIADWRAALRRYASSWNENEKAKRIRSDHRSQKALIEYPEPKVKLPRLMP